MSALYRNSLAKLTQNQNLSEREIVDFIEAMRDDTVTDAQIAGFLVALLMKGPSIDEVAYIARAMRANCVQIAPAVEGDLIDLCGTGGGLTTFNVSSANSILVAAAGVPVAKHGSRSISSSSGSADVLEALGIKVEIAPDQGRALIEQVGWSFLYAPAFHPIMLKVFFPEQALGIKTIFFTIIGPLINPAGAPRHLLGVYQPGLVGMVADVVAQLDMRHVIIAHGLDNLDEISILGRTSIAEVKGSTVERYEIAPEDFGFPRATIEDIGGGTPQYNAEVIRNIFAGSDEGPRRDFLLLNSGFALYAAGAADSPEKGIALAQQILSSGAAAQKLEQIVAASNALA
ncbi:MAG: anthranilate phosphoribosyltransferase [Frankiaceae bacterium]|jgi:anthranilate phosphoribosyltransferase|nr:anthranilate phosphoribosyltransferase [Frankiaceae bacterium]